jgi:hypothetical protein
MLKSPLLNALLQRFPQKTWNLLSSLYTFFTLPTIGSPISFKYDGFRLVEYVTTCMPPSIHQEFLSFCYPSDMPDRETEIECDRRNYWEGTSTFLVYKGPEIVGCVQIIPKTVSQKLPVEYARIQKNDGSLEEFEIASLLPDDNVTEIYRCRRSFDLNRMEAINVLLMLYKAIWAKVIQLGTAYTCISFDSSKQVLKSLYVKKIAFTDPGITLFFGSNPKKWNLLIKDWAEHERSYATISKSHFFLQTWFRSSLKKQHLHLPNRAPVGVTDAHIATEAEGTVLYTTTITTSKTRKKRSDSPDQQSEIPHYKRYVHFNGRKNQRLKPVEPNNEE